MAKKKSVKTQLDELDEWLNGLTELDRINFSILVSHPEMAMKLPDSSYRDKVILAMALSQVFLSGEGP